MRSGWSFLKIRSVCFLSDIAQKALAIPCSHAKIIQLVFPLPFGLLDCLATVSKPFDLNTLSVSAEWVFFFQLDCDSRKNNLQCNRESRNMVMSTRSNGDGMTPDELKRARKALGMSRSELARAIGSNHSTIGSWETGRHKVSAVAEKSIRDLMEAKVV